MKYQLGSVTRIGNRKENEDSYGSFSNDNALLMVVADGMGGHQGGKLASQMVVKCAGKLFAKQRNLIPDPAEFLQQLILLTHQKIGELGARQQPPIDPRTTGVFCLIQGGYAWWAHVGDSRLYHFRDDRLYFRTRDHSRIEELMQQGLVTPKEALTHPYRHQITRCLGGADPIKQITLTKEIPLEAGDTILMCSDGLWNALGSKHILRFIDNEQVDEIASNLASEAEELSMPRSDNVTVLVLRWLDENRTYYQPDKAAKPTPATTAEKEKGDDGAEEDKEELDEMVDTLKSIFDEYEDELKGS